MVYKILPKIFTGVHKAMYYIRILLFLAVLLTMISREIESINIPCLVQSVSGQRLVYVLTCSPAESEGQRSR